MSILSIVVLRSCFMLGVSILRGLASMNEIGLFVISRGALFSYALRISTYKGGSARPTLSRCRPQSILIGRVFSPSLLSIIRGKRIYDFRRKISVAPWVNGYAAWTVASSLAVSVVRWLYYLAV